MYQKPQSISSVVSEIKQSLEEEYRDVLVEGEISNLSSSSAGHWYFTLSDDRASLSCALFRQDALKNPYIQKSRDGDRVICQGPLSVYLKRGTFQLIAKKMVPFGKGDLKARFEMLKKKLSQEGLFDLERKKKLPRYPKKIIVITAIQGAALQDFLNVFLRRCLWCHIVIIPALVQGQAAPKSLLDALKKVKAINKIDSIDVVVMTRGGGSMEDLWAFNDEALVRAIAGLDIPFISAVGHQVDYTLCDYVADLRCETPTASAEVLTQPHTEISRQLAQNKERLVSLLEKTQYRLQSKLQNYHPRRVLDKIYHLFNNKVKSLNRLRLSDRLFELTRIHEFHQRLDEALSQAQYANKANFKKTEYQLERASKLLDAYNPHQVLKRGYVIVQSEKYSVISSAKDFNSLSAKQSYRLKFYDAEVLQEKN